MSTYPTGRTARDRFVVDRRGSRPARDPWKHQGVVVEPEPDEAGHLRTTATVFLTGLECAWRCVMCDLWHFTTDTDTPAGAIAAQVRDARNGLDAEGVEPDVWKLYNASSFFDRRAVPPTDDQHVADLVGRASLVVVESHPALVGDRAWRFRDRLAQTGTALEVAMGLETVHPEALGAINQGVSVDGFGAAARARRREGVSLRVFLLVHPPFVPVGERREWLRRSVVFARECGASVVSLIATRPGEGALLALAAEGLYVAPTLCDLEQASADAFETTGLRVFADLWDIEQHSRCPHCLDSRRARLERQNAEQRVAAAVTCWQCAGQVAS